MTRHPCLLRTEGVGIVRAEIRTDQGLFLLVFEAELHEGHARLPAPRLLAFLCPPLLFRF